MPILPLSHTFFLSLSHRENSAPPVIGNVTEMGTSSVTELEDGEHSQQRPK